MDYADNALYWPSFGIVLESLSHEQTPEHALNRWHDYKDSLQAFVFRVTVSQSNIGFRHEKEPHRVPGRHLSS